MRYLVLILLLFSCNVQKKHIAINRYFIVSKISGDYVRVYSPSTPESLYPLDFDVYYPTPVKVGDTLVVMQKNRRIHSLQEYSKIKSPY